MNFDLKKATNILSQKFDNWLESLTAMLPNVVVALLVLILFYFLARGARLITSRLLSRFSQKVAINNLFVTSIYLLVLGLGLIMALNVLHLDQTVSSLLAGAGIVGLALSFAFQDITTNFISGILMAFREPIQVGDIVKIGEFMGTVEKIDLRVTVVKTFQGLHVLIPNKDVFQNAVTNYTKTKERRIDLEVGVSYGENLEQVKRIALEAISRLPYLLPNKDLNFFYTAFADSSINFVIMLWVHYPDEPGFFKARSDAIMQIKKAFDNNGISIPYPIRTLDFGIKGGEKLSQMKLSIDSPRKTPASEQVAELN